ncbi:hypothetical protein ACFV9C_42725 [Kribbella sp. NPDC059898]|uniref:hypothetical protein n=1 Tax=Kribbella sp. NPDC059898 TaxID=3346995 RepID=UPI00364C40A3
MTLYRGETPMTPEEARDYEIERELDAMCSEGLLLRVVADNEPARYIKTRKGRAELASPQDD